METNNMKIGAVNLKKVIDGCNALLGTLKIRVEDMDETGRIIQAVRSNLSNCSNFVEAEYINVVDVAPAPIKPVIEEPAVEEPQLVEEEVVADDGNGEFKSESECNEPNA